MTPKEKAIELVDKYCNMHSHCDNAKECALILVDEIIKIERITIGINKNYWQEVQVEIENL